MFIASWAQLRARRAYRPLHRIYTIFSITPPFRKRRHKFVQNSFSLKSVSPLEDN